MRSLARRLSRALLVAGLALALVAASAGPLRAGPYADKDSDPMRILYYAVYPAAKAAEWLVFRPLHFLGQLVAPDEDERRALSEQCRSTERRPHRHCRPG